MTEAPRLPGTMEEAAHTRWRAVVVGVVVATWINAFDPISGFLIHSWPTYVLPNLQRWLVPGNDGGGVSFFYQGLAPGQRAPWGIWAVPLFWWLLLLASIMAACFCLSVILRKQWSERERLAFPLVEVSLSLVREPEPGRLLPSFVHDRLFWAGFGITAFLYGRTPTP